uniref:Uncharacterized protein n=1 Tax=Caenorhabditis japonica TaxID=281687 RepID=A0A8R1IUE2_CAEJA
MDAPASNYCATYASANAKQQHKWFSANKCDSSPSLELFNVANNRVHQLNWNLMINNWTPGNNERKGEEGLGDRRYKEKKNWQLTHPACIQGHTSSSHQRILMVPTNDESLNHATAKTHHPHTTMRSFTKLSPPKLLNSQLSTTAIFGTPANVGLSEEDSWSCNEMDWNQC